MQLMRFLQKKAQEAMQHAFPQEKELAEITTCQNEKFGHYQCNNALRLAKSVKKPPRVVAEKIVEALKHSGDSSLFSQITIDGPGFINFTFHPSFLAKQVKKLFMDPKLGVETSFSHEKIIIEFSSPNIAKELHVGHLRSTIIGECLARLFEFLGYDVLRLNHMGDWGTQFGMLIAYLKEKDPHFLQEKREMSLEELTAFYKAAKQKFDQDPVFKKKAQAEVVALQAKEKQALQIWQHICDLSRKAFQKIYGLLEVTLQERGESFYNPFLPKIVEALEKKGLLELSEGAKCVFLPGFRGKDQKPLPLIVQKSDGGYNYATTDLAALWHRVHQEKAKRIILVVDQGQSLHFEMVFAAAQKAGFYDSEKIKVEHVGFGLVLGPDGKKLKTRSGETIKLVDLLMEGVDYAKKILQEKEPLMPEEEKKRLAQHLAMAAIKYADLSSHRQKDYVFSYERMLRFEGNTAIFLLYSYVRIQGIKRKIGVSSLPEIAELQLTHPTEIALAFHLLRFAEVLQQLSEDLLPHRLTDYLYELAERFNAFFRDCRVEGSQEQESRLFLCEAVGKVLKQGLYILGIPTVDRM